MTGSQKHNQHKFCSEPLELVENYKQAQAENFKGWCIHHRLEIQPDGTRMSRQELKDKGLYYDRPASELIFMRAPEHKRLHLIGNAINKGKHLSEETRKKMSEARKGKHKSAETRKKISEAKKGENNYWFGKHHSEETRKKMSEARKGKHWWNDGVSCKRAKECPGEGWTRGRLRCK